jgi:hypothetical protein
MLRFRSVSNWRGWRETLPKEALAPDRRALNHLYVAELQEPTTVKPPPLFFGAEV